MSYVNLFVLIQCFVRPSQKLLSQGQVQNPNSMELPFVLLLFPADSSHTRHTFLLAHSSQFGHKNKSSVTPNLFSVRFKCIFSPQQLKHELRFTKLGLPNKIWSLWIFSNLQSVVFGQWGGIHPRCRQGLSPGCPMVLAERYSQRSSYSPSSGSECFKKCFICSEMNALPLA